MKNAAHERETEMKHMEFLKEQLQNQFFQVTFLFFLLSF